MIDYSQILTVNYVGSEWSLHGDLYDGLIWHSNTPKPTKSELDALWDITQQKILDQKQTAESAKQASFNKLAALGLTADDLKNILG